MAQKIIYLILYLYAIWAFPACQSDVNPDDSGLFIKFLGGARNETAYALAETADGGFVVVGTSESFDQNHQVYVAKVDRLGNRQWQQSWGDSSRVQGGRDILVLDNGHLLVLGFTAPEASPEQGQFLLLELSADGQVFTDGKIVGDTLLRAQADMYLSKGQDNSFYLIGNTLRESRAPTSDMYVVKITDLATHQIAFARSYGLINRDDQVGSILVDSLTQDIFWCGTSNRNTTLSDMRIVRADVFGNLRWDFAIGENNNSTETGADIQVCPDNSGMIAVGTVDHDNEQDVLLVKIDRNGEVLWRRELGGPEDQEGRSVAPTADGGYIITGSTVTVAETPLGLTSTPDILLMKVNALGEPEWTQSFGYRNGPDVGQLVKQSGQDQGYILVGTVWFKIIRL
ncbi:MAG: hypothetical protein HC880_04395 [Bacteroidia bacterium]|nr:hypothetical protein [Bacteroidia bacterium]